MNRSIEAVVLVLALGAVAAMAAVTAMPATAAMPETPATTAVGPPAARDGQAAQGPVAPWSAEPVCPSALAPGFDPGSVLDWTAQPQVGAPCCESLCEQVCGVGEACFCKRCQVLGCGV